MGTRGKGEYTCCEKREVAILKKRGGVGNILWNRGREDGVAPRVRG